MDDKESLLEPRLSKAESEIHKLWLVMEGEIRSDISKLVENFPDLQKLKEEREKIQDLDSILKTLMRVVESHSEDLLELKRYFNYLD